MISTPLSRGETYASVLRISPMHFQSSLMRGETGGTTLNAMLRDIFQSTPLMRGETTRTSWRERRGRFQSAPLIRGETYRTLYRALGMEVFQSAPLMRGETAGRGDQKPDEQISIHSPHARGDKRCTPSTLRIGNFNPLPSCEGRRGSIPPRAEQQEFQSAPLSRGETSIWMS